ncbi:MAG: hypothetical protein P8N76_01930 [Pirellulaceae bacterium]|nr:hypothetical protein [Pirellulaceae bacterium]
MRQEVLAQPLGPEGLRGVNQMPNPSFEEEGPGGEEHALGWVGRPPAENRGWVTRIQGEARKGDWSMEYDNTAPSDFGQWKEFKNNDRSEHIGGTLILPDTGLDFTYGPPDNCLACYPVLPSESYTQSAWVMMTDPFVPSDGASILRLGSRLNFGGGAGGEPLDDDGNYVSNLLTPLDDLTLNEWVFFKKNVHPAQTYCER